MGHGWVWEGERDGEGERVEGSGREIREERGEQKGRVVDRGVRLREEGY